MAKYMNVVTGAILETECKLSGKDWKFAPDKKIAKKKVTKKKSAKAKKKTVAEAEAVPEGTEETNAKVEE